MVFMRFPKESVIPERLNILKTVLKGKVDGYHK